MVLTGYEEMAKCSRVLNAAHYSRRMSLRNIIVEDSVFGQHESKYKITMSYLDDWLKSLDEIRLTFMKRVRSIEPPKKRASRRKIYRQGLKVRNACLYVDYRRGWVDTGNVSRKEVWRNLEMLRDMMGGFRSFLANCDFATS